MEAEGECALEVILLCSVRCYFFSFAASSRVRALCQVVLMQLIEMKTLVANIWSRFRTELSRMDEKDGAVDLQQEDGYTVGPVAGKLDVQFIKL